MLVAHREHLIVQEDVWWQLDSDGEAEPHFHCGRLVLDGATPRPPYIKVVEKHALVTACPQVGETSTLPT
jgi:hypothetical protein